jgi:NAD(P)-dependent dehydrogenase (short-subunit alcohol dehydrogenase family)
VTLAGSRVLVTGAAKRVGREIALALAERGARVAIHFNASADEAERTADDAKARGGDAVTVRADLTDERQIEAMVLKAAGAWGGLDGLVNNAAVFFRTPLDTMTEADWDRTLDPNLKGTFFCSLHAGRLMAKQDGGGAIISIADWAGERPYAGYVPYCVGKAGVIAMTKGMAKSFAPGVRVNAILPGPVLVPTDLPKDEADEIMERTPLKRHGSPADIARAVIYLLEADFTTGALLPVDGGRLIA